MSELFDEIDEDVRRDQLKKLWEQHSFAIIAIIVLIIAGVGGWRGYQYVETRKAQEASAAFDRAAELSTQDKSAEAEAAFNKVATDAPSGYRTLARLRAAAEAAKRDSAAAVKQYDDIVADRGIDAPSRDLARVRAGSLVVDTAAYDAMVQRLEPAASATGAYRHSARELLALSAWRSGDMTAARQWLDQIANDAETPSSLRSRSEALQALLPAVAKS